MKQSVNSENYLSICAEKIKSFIGNYITVYFFTGLVLVIDISVSKVLDYSVYNKWLG